ncbi:MAG: nucleotidyltransferase family protein [Clostridia bacterium]|nr:nucleotidyltransferase family protein [Clostridia bacterium]
MTKEQALLLELIAYNITGEEISGDVDGIDWISLIKESISQTVSLVAFDSVTPFKEKINKDIYNKWFNRSFKDMTINSLVEKSQKNLVTLLKNKNYEYVILKGLSASSYYNKPELRLLGDVDFLIENEKKEEIKEYLKANGYVASLEDHICHIVFNKPKEHLEMHFEIAGIPDGAIGDKVRLFMQGVLNEPEAVTTGSGFNAPKEKYHAVILLLHMQHHLLGEGIGLRHLMDWACFVNRTYNKDFWKTDVIPFLKEIGLLAYMNAVTAVCIRYFKIPAPIWAEAVEESLTEALIEDILSGGNFGRKDKLRSESGIMISNRGKDGTKKSKIYYLHKHLKNSVENTYPFVKKCKILFPFAYFYRMARYFVLSCFGKRTSFAKTVPLADKRRALYNKLHIYEVQNNE